ncbi:hypothetical protein FACS189463_3660 [Bacteroidia bacterium]|nr:hypothetical protein FACS189463_3660 [Bacteroidia bacterium]
MEWSAISNTPWIKIASAPEGIDTDYITLEVEPNESDAKRIGSVTVTAPETAEYAKNVIIQQLNEDVSGIESVKSPAMPKISHIPGTNGYSAVLDETAQNIHLDVYSVSGQLVLRNYFYNTSNFGFNLSHCNKGVYLAKIVYDGKSYIQKIIK